MNLQRREEIREMIAEIEVSVLDGSATVRDLCTLDAMRELLAHIDALEQAAAERVIARGAAVKPHTFAEIVNAVRDIASQYAGTEQLRERISYELGRHFVLDGGPTPDYTGEGSAWVPEKTESPSVTDTEKSAYERRLFSSSAPCESSFRRGWVAHECEYGKYSHAIPSHRVPGEVMVAVKWIHVSESIPENQQNVGFIVDCKRDEFLHGRVYGGRFFADDFHAGFGGFNTHGMSCQASHWFAFPSIPDALRANQGGTDHD